MARNTDELLKQSNLRMFAQWGGARPNNKMAFAGVNAQYLYLDGVSNPVAGDASPIRVPHPTVRGAFKLVGRSISAPDLPKATLTIHEKRKALPRGLVGERCSFNLYEYAGMCADLSDQISGWDDYILVYSGAMVNSADHGARTQREGDDPLTTQLGITLDSLYPVGRLAFGEQAAATTAAAVFDVTYGNSLRCGVCGPTNDGTKWLYSVTNGAVAAKPGILYSVDGGANWTLLAISTAANADVPVNIRIMGQTLFVTVLAASVSEIHWTTINAQTGVPSSSFTKVTTGFVAAKNAQDAFVVNGSDAFIAGKAGYIYRTSDPTAGVSVAAIVHATYDVLRIHGDGDTTLLAVGKTGLCMKSTNGGLTWSATTTSPEAADLTAVCVLDEFRFWVASATKLYYTLDGGETWTQATWAAVGASAISDIIAPTMDVIHVAYVASSVGKICTSWNGGATFTTLAPRISGLPTCLSINKLAAPRTENAAVDANNLMGGTSLTGSPNDGSIFLGIAAVL